MFVFYLIFWLCVCWWLAWMFDCLVFNLILFVGFALFFVVVLWVCTCWFWICFVWFDLDVLLWFRVWVECITYFFKSFGCYIVTWFWVFYMCFTLCDLWFLHVFYCFGGWFGFNCCYLFGLLTIFTLFLFVYAVCYSCWFWVFVGLFDWLWVTVCLLGFFFGFDCLIYFCGFDCFALIIVGTLDGWILCWFLLLCVGWCLFWNLLLFGFWIDWCCFAAVILVVCLLFVLLLWPLLDFTSL